MSTQQPVANSSLNRPGIWATAPEVLLVLLFEHGTRAALQDDGLPFPIRVSHVCRYWRFVATSTPAVWTGVPVHPLRSGLAQFFFERLGDYLPVDLSIHIRSERNADATIAFVLQQHERVRDVYLRAHGNPAVFIFISRIRSISLPRLRHFEINLTKNPKGGALGHLPAILDGEPSTTLDSVALRGACFDYHSPMLKGLTRLTLGDLPRRMAAPSYATFRDLLTASPRLTYLKLDDVFPVLTEAIDYGAIELPHLQVLELVMERDSTYVLDFFTVLSLPQIDTLSFESPWQITWEGFEMSFPLLQATFPSVRTLRLSATGQPGFHNAGVRPELFGIFPRLEYLTLAAYDDKIIHYYLQPWIAVMQGHLEDDPLKQGPSPVWPGLQLLTVRVPFDSRDEEDEEDSIDELLEFLGSLRMSMDLPFDVWQECV